MALSDFGLSSVVGIAASAGLFLSLVSLYTISRLAYNNWFHPLAHIPGPISASASGLTYNLHMRNGTIIPWLMDLHKKYGDVVRVNPTEVSFISGDTAWQDIYGFRTGKNKTGAYLKDRSWFAKPVVKTYSLIVADEPTHSRMRRNLSHAFSDKALRDQEGIVQGFVDLLVHRLHEQVQNNVYAIDIMRWYNYTTFDIITDLTFGEPLYCLRDKDYHPWVNMVFASAKAISLLVAKRNFPIFAYYDRIKGIFCPKPDAIKQRKKFFELATQKVTNRLERETMRPDFMSYVVKSQAIEAKALTREEIDTNAVLFLVAGSETTATMLSGTTYLLLKNPAVYAKLVHEIRSRFNTQSDITFDEVNKLDYMIACLQEGLRYYPPAPTGFPRVVPQGGDTISGHYIPEGTSVYVSQYAASHSESNWTDPEAYAPERWLGDKRYKDDKRTAINPFSFGPRNCLGKNLAYAEMRLILAKVLFNFDLELVDKSADWIKQQKVFVLWEKGSLMVKLNPVQR
ncbi:cytochrome P450 monooxygenase-like protein [Massariosphaeria phaeospora]|uniref:Cytochrome P450 monooxygenase-like protein n=1 Tax=Massariosphaeria phaeospora TaxID=100035 RepID=A0A7C8MG50_9PLEO|nr:cytochrome P450 monooxygenase-like protein [Massariosphaeria phaeospora]